MYIVYFSHTLYILSYILCTTNSTFVNAFRHTDLSDEIGAPETFQIFFMRRIRLSIIHSCMSFNLTMTHDSNKCEFPIYMPECLSDGLILRICRGKFNNIAVFNHLSRVYHFICTSFETHCFSTCMVNLYNIIL